MTECDSLEVPPFLKRTPERHAELMAWNASHPVTALTLSGGPKAPPELWEQREAERRELDKQKSYERLAKMKATTGPLARSEPTDTSDMDWSDGRWVRPDYMSLARYTRLWHEMPSDDHRHALADMFPEAAKLFGKTGAATGVSHPRS